MPPGARAPWLGPLVPNSPLRYRPLDGRYRMVDLGFPPPSLGHIRRPVPPRNEEPPESQGGIAVFGDVLRKEHEIAHTAAFAGNIWNGVRLKRIKTVNQWLMLEGRRRELVAIRRQCEIRTNSTHLRPAPGPREAAANR